MPLHAPYDSQVLLQRMLVAPWDEILSYWLTIPMRERDAVYGTLEGRAIALHLIGRPNDAVNHRIAQRILSRIEEQG